MIPSDHFERVAPVYESLRTTDEAPVRTIRQLLPDRPVTGVDVGCGTGRYSKLLRALLPEGSLLIASDVAAAMLAQLQAGNRGPGRVAPLLSTAEQLSIRSDSLDLVTSFNSVHHFDLGRFLTDVARVLRPGGQLFVYTRTPQQNARTIWGQYFPGFTDREQRLHSRGDLLAAVDQTSGLGDRQHAHLPLPALEHQRAAQGPGRGAPLLDVQPLHPATSWPRPSRPSSPACPASEARWVDESLLLVARGTSAAPSARRASA